MATLSTAQQALLQEPIDLLLKGTAREMPLSQDVVQRIATYMASLDDAFSSGLVFEAARDNPVSFLIALVLGTGHDVLSATEQSQLGAGIELMIVGQAYETPFAEDVIARIEPAAESTGFMTKGGFREAIRDRPVSTMLQWALKLGSQ